MDFNSSNGWTRWAARNWWLKIVRSLVMNRHILMGLVALLAANSLLLAAQPDYKPGVVLVRFANVPNTTTEPNTAAKNAILNSVLGRGGSLIKREYTLVKGLAHVSLPAGMSVENAIASLKGSSSVLSAEPDYKLRKFTVPNDTRFGELWGLHNTGQAGGTPGADIGATEAWDINTGSKNVIVAVTDSGVDYTHPDLAANMWSDTDGSHGYDFGDNDGNPMDDSADANHGTHVAGIIGAVGNNGVGVTGVCWHVSIMAVKIADSSGALYESAAVAGIQYAVAKGAKVINASWGFDPGVSFSTVQSLYNAIAAARDAGVIFVTGAGNNTNNNNDASPVYPASFDLPNIISVMATSNTDQQAFYSNYGLTSVDLGAPGGEWYFQYDPKSILSTLPGNQYQFFQGTSMASPYVAGACALILSIDPTLTYSQVKQILLDTVDPTLPGLCVSGGRLNLFAAAQEAKTDTTPPTPNPPIWDIQPQATGLHTVTMRAGTATDRSGVEYYFECVNDVNINSGWEPNTLYSLTTLNSNTTYAFHFKARDKSAQHNQTNWSTTISTTTANLTDTKWPAPAQPAWAQETHMVRQIFPFSISMQAATAYDESGVEYRFMETTGTGIDSGWQSSSIYTIQSTLFLSGNTYTFRVQVRDKSAAHNTSGLFAYSSVGVATGGTRILKVPSVYQTIQDAITAAVNGDTVEISPYPYPPYVYTGYHNVNIDFKKKKITVRSIDPTNPAIVASTIIDCQGTPDPYNPIRAFIFQTGEGSDSVLAGLTIRNGYIKGLPGTNGAGGTFGSVAPGGLNGSPGSDGGGAVGGAILCTLSSSPTISNCVIENCIVDGGDAGNGGNGADGNDFKAGDSTATPPTPSQPATTGGNGAPGGSSGDAKGGGIYAESGSSPTIQSCTISGCMARPGLAGNGGSGGNGGHNGTIQLRGGDGGNGGNVGSTLGGGICAYWNNTQIIGCNITDCNAFNFSLPGQAGGGGIILGITGQPGYYGNATGGGVYYAMTGDTPISSTNFSGNQVDSYVGGKGGGFCGARNPPLSITLTMSDCNFIGNTAGAVYYDTSDGGGLYLAGGDPTVNYLTLTNCHITNNIAQLDGGGAYVSGFNTQINSSTVTGNTAPYGGGMCLLDISSGVVLTVQDSNFLSNSAEEGGAAYIYNCHVNMSSSGITHNSASMPQGSLLEGGLGGGLALWDSYGNIEGCLINSNSAGDKGGAAFAEGISNFPLQFINCLITDNTAVYDGGALSNKTSAWTTLINCTVVNNSATDATNGSGGGVSCAEDYAWVEIINSILWGNTAAYGPQIGVGTTFGSAGDANTNVDVMYSDVEGGVDDVFIQQQDVTDLWWWDGSFDADPLFVGVAVNQPAYYLSQFAAGQDVNSPCVDTGDPAIDLETMMSVPPLTLTTRTDLVADTGIVDIGYHYLAGSVGSAGQYPLTIEVYQYSAVEGGHGRLKAKPLPLNSTQFDINDPNTIQVNQGTIVDLNTFNIDPGFKVLSWSGTDNDTSTALTNTVTMNSGKTVIVTFAPNGMYYLTVNVTGNGTVDPNGRHLYAAGAVIPLIATPNNPGDTIIWTGTDNDNTDANNNTVTMSMNRIVNVQFYTPRVLRVGGGSEYSTIQAAIDAAHERDIIILMPSDQPYYTQAGYTIDGRNLTITSSNPDDPAVVASTIIQQQTGPNGGVNPAFLFRNVGPLMRLQGITIRRFFVGGLNGLNGDPTRFYYDGQYGDTVGAMGIDCITNASPTIKNCVIDDCHTTGGNGGNGAGGNFGATPPHPDAGNGGWPGGAWGGGLICYDNSSPTIINCTFSNNTASGGNGGDGGNGSGLPNTGNGGRGGGWHYGIDEQPPSPWEPGAYMGGEPKDWSGLGGAVYVGTSCYPIFEDCNFTNNSSTGGLNGICGQTPIANLRAEPSIRYKIANLGGAVYLAEYSSADFNNCTFTTNLADTNESPASFDGFLGYGGAIAADEYAILTINNCRFNNNTGDIGGGVYSSLADADVNDSNFSGNTATHGGGLLFSDSVTHVTGSIFSGNVGIISGSNGGAIALLGTNAEIADCNITNNHVGGSGGGIYMSSENIDGSEVEGDNYVLVKNCLITYNVADLDGGGISANWYSEPNIVNCTIYNNTVSGLGGGLFSSYGSYVNVLNSIIWDNRVGIGSSGSQIAVSGAEPPATMQVRYSDVQDSNDPCSTQDINTMDFAICFDTTGSMEGDITAFTTAARQIVNAIATQFASYRLGLVDFRDYPDGNHGALGDWAYRDRVTFTTDTNQLIAGLQAMNASGGADGPEAIYTALMHSIDANALVARLTANGYTNYIDPNSPGLGNWRQGRKVIRVILLLTDAPPHDPEPYTNYVLNDIVTAATGNNPIHIIPVVIRGDPTAEDALRSVAIGTGGILISATDSNAVPAAVLDAISLLSQIPAPISVGTGGTINWDPTTFIWAPDSNNINADPLFIGGFLLKQIAAGQDVNSPCVDTGSADVNSPDINLGGYTTRTDSVADACKVDMGYHYSAFTPTQYTLNFTTIAVSGLLPAQQPTIIEPTRSLFNWYETVQLKVNVPPTGYEVQWTGTDNDDINDVNNTVLMSGNRVVTATFVKNSCHLTVMHNIGGSVTPSDGNYSRGTVVTLTATHDVGYRIESWQGTNNDGLFTPTNTVTMNGDVNVIVTFSLPQTLTVPGDFTTIQGAIQASRPGDIVSVASGVYHGNRITIDREITIASTNPDDPCVVAATIIDSSGFATPAIVFTSGATSNTVLDGFTITGGTWYIVASQNATVAGQNGPDGSGAAGGAVVINTGASPTLRNCVIRDTNMTGGNAGSGGNADTTVAAGRGGWAGWARGGGVYVAQFANPTLINCTVTNCSATGGNAGNGGNSSGSVYGAPEYRDANYGGSYSNPYPSYQIPPQPWQEMSSSSGGQYVGDYRFYSGYGGGVFCDTNSEANFIGCNITNNIARGGVSGVGGTRPQGIVSADPITAYRIPSYGGGVYCGANSDINFVGCNIASNVTPRPDTTYHTDPYLGHGGGIAFEESTKIRLIDCTISDNNSAVGGGVFWSGGSPELLDCNVFNNVAYVGGGIYATESSGQIKGCTLRNNFAGISPNDVDVVAGQGGGIFGSSIDTNIVDCVLTDNISSASGAGIHIYGPADNDTIIKNCLLLNNQAGRDGGGISINWGAVASVANCTLYGNQVTGNYGVLGSTGYGGGLYCSYDASTEIKNSIFWNNNGIFGPQIAEGTGFEYEPRCGDINVSYSDIEGGQVGAYIGSGCPSNWGNGNINRDPCFINGFFLSQIAAGQNINSSCVDAGSGNVNSPDINLVGYTTRTDSGSDTGIVDMGYHYSAFTPLQYHLTIVAGYGLTSGDITPSVGNYVRFSKVTLHVTAPVPASYRVQWTGTDNDACTVSTNTVTMNSDKTVVVGFEPNGLYYLTVTAIGDGTVDPNGRNLHAPGEVVTLTATPTNPSDAIIWTGTDDDYSIARQNTVTMNGHKNVTVEFYTPRVLYVGTDPHYPTIQFAIDDANDRDIVMITPGTYNIYESSMDRPYLYISGKSIRLTSTNPEDANATQIIGGFVIDNADRNLIIEGLTIRDAIYWKDYESGLLQGGQSGETYWATPQGAGADGYGGGTCRGAGMQLNGAASPTVRNCRFVNCVARGVHGATGAGGSGTDGYSGNGGPGGKAFGGGAYCGQDGSPLFENCVFINCSARAGDAGNGGSAAPATGGHGGAWGDSNEVWWDDWKQLYGTIHPLEEYWKYSGYGGAIYCDTNSTAEFNNCTFTSNSVMGSSCGISGASVPSGWPTQHYKIESFGGAVYAASGSMPYFVDCNFTDNEANMQGPPTNRIDNIATVNAYPNVSFGGAVAFEDSAAPVFEKCTFNNNRATVGGGAFAARAYGIVTDCNFEDNSSYNGGGILYVGGTSEIENSRFTGNQSTVSAAQGGAITLLGADAEVRDCNIWNNASAGSGGGIYISSRDVGGTELPGGNSVLIRNCLITGNLAGQNGAGISATWYSDPNIVNCTITGNIAQGMGGGLYSAYNNYTKIINSIFWDNNAPQGPQIAVGATDNPSYVKVTYSDIEGGAAEVYLVPRATLEWDVVTNINSDPLFINGFFLSQVVAGQDINSPCVDTGSADVNSPDINLGDYTTRTDSVADACKVDMGYHYSAFTPPKYHLTIIALDGLTSADVTPSDGNYIWFSKVPLHVSATPPAGYQIVWTGTSNDDISGRDNFVHMSGDQTVTVGFGKNTCNLTVVWNDGGTVTPTGGTYPRGTKVDLTATPDPSYRIDSWQGTDDDSSSARTNQVTMNRDKTVRVTFSLPHTITVPGDFTSIQAAIEAARSGDIVSVASGVYHGTTIVLNKEITLASTNPDDPCVVAATVIDSTGYQGGLALLFTAGATADTVVDGFTITSGTYGIISAQNATATGQNGPDGGSIQGGTVYINTGASPTLRNCVIRDTNITGGNAGNGGNADTTTPGGRGGWGGWARGGGIYIAQFANPTLINCTVTNCSVTGGNGGNGGNSSGSIFGAADYQDANYGGLWSNDFSFPWWTLSPSTGGQYVGDYRFYSGYGGGVFCDANSAATFIDCNIINNTASGGMSGVGGTRPQGIFIPDPVTAYRIGGYGGGVYCGENANIDFENCLISGNVAPKPDTTYHSNPYLGHGGGIAFENTANIRFENCTITGNTSAVGGGMFWSGGSPAVLDCNVINNIAYVGGGIYATGSSGQIKDCTLRGNFAGVSTGDVDVIAGQGGGIFGSSISANIIDCVLINNISSASGAGIHIYGPASTETIIRNCLLTNNQSGRDGAGISVNWGAIAVIDNCTLYDNQTTGLYGVRGDTGFGGGLYCSYDASTDVNNSIFWDNNSLFGSEIYIGTDTNHEPRCGNVTVTFSDIQGGQAGVYVGDIGGYGCPFAWGAGNKNSDPQFVNALGDDFHLKSISAGQTVDSNCIDAGGNPAELYGLFRYSTSTLGTPDMGVVDLGYHYPIADYCRRWDLFIDNAVNFRDLAILASSWVGGVGGGTSGYYLADLADFTDCWLEDLPTDITPPAPNPMTWSIPPRVLTASSVEMKATIAHDASGVVYYQFEDVNGTPTAWQVDPCYIATGISSTGEHCFRVRARDRYNNVTDWSDYNDRTGIGCVTDIGDVIAPSPAPRMIVSFPSGDPDTNDTSEQFHWPGELDWWHKIVVDVSGITDDITPAAELEVRFICDTDDGFSSDNIIPATYRPIRIGHPVAIGARIKDGVGTKEGSYRLTWSTTAANTIVYDVFVNSYGGGVGVPLRWHVCVYDSSGNSTCSDTFLIPAP